MLPYFTQSAHFCVVHKQTNTRMDRQSDYSATSVIRTPIFRNLDYPVLKSQKLLKVKVQLQLCACANATCSIARGYYNNYTVQLSGLIQLSGTLLKIFGQRGPDNRGRTVLYPLCASARGKHLTDTPITLPLVRASRARGNIYRMDWKQHNFWCPFRRAVMWYSVIGGKKERDEYCCSCNVSSVNMASGIIRAGF